MANKKRTIKCHYCQADFVPHSEAYYEHMNVLCPINTHIEADKKHEDRINRIIQFSATPAGYDEADDLLDLIEEMIQEAITERSKQKIHERLEEE